MCPTPLTSPTQDSTGPSVPAMGLWDSTAVTQEMFGAWTCAWSAWGDYLNRLATASGPMAVMDAGAQLMTDSLEVCSRAAAIRLRAGGLSGPLLNDA